LLVKRLVRVCFFILGDTFTLSEKLATF